MKEIILRHGEVTIVDDADFDSLSEFLWTKNGRGYVRRYAKGRIEILMHREVTELSKDDGRLVDHKNGDRLDNRRENLRICTTAENSLNRALQRNSTSGYKGVTLHKGTGKWQAGITFQGKTTHLGLFPTAESASEAYRKAAIRLHGEFACFDR